MPTLREDLVPVVDAGRQLVDTLGFRLRPVIVRTRTWSGGRVGSGTATNADVTLTPRPKVAEPPARVLSESGGRWEAGDLQVTRVSATYDEADLAPAVTAGVEVVYLVDGREYAIVGAPARRSFGWDLQLRRRTRAAP